MLPWRVYFFNSRFLAKRPKSTPLSSALNDQRANGVEQSADMGRDVWNIYFLEGSSRWQSVDADKAEVTTGQLASRGQLRSTF